VDNTTEESMQLISEISKSQRGLEDQFRKIKNRSAHTKTLMMKSTQNCKRHQWVMRLAEVQARKRRENEATQENVKGAAKTDNTAFGALPEHDACISMLKEQRRFKNLVKKDSDEAWTAEWDEKAERKRVKEERRALNKKPDHRQVRRDAVVAAAEAERQAAAAGRPWGLEPSAIAELHKDKHKEEQKRLRTNKLAWIDLEGPSVEDKYAALDEWKAKFDQRREKQEKELARLGSSPMLVFPTKVEALRKKLLRQDTELEEETKKYTGTRPAWGCGAPIYRKKPTRSLPPRPSSALAYYSKPRNPIVPTKPFESPTMVRATSPPHPTQPASMAPSSRPRSGSTMQPKAGLDS